MKEQKNYLLSLRVRIQENKKRCYLQKISYSAIGQHFFDNPDYANIFSLNLFNILTFVGFSFHLKILECFFPTRQPFALFLKHYPGYLCWLTISLAFFFVLVLRWHTGIRFRTFYLDFSIGNIFLIPILNLSTILFEKSESKS